MVCIHIHIHIYIAGYGRCLVSTDPLKSRRKEDTRLESADLSLDLTEDMFSFKSSWKSLALTLLSTLHLAESVLAAQYIFTVFTAASESNMNVYHSTDATYFDLVKEDAYVRNPAS